MAKDDEFWGVIGELATKLDPPLKVRTTAEADAERKKPGLFHFRHQYVNVDAHNMISTEFGHITRVLKRCTACGDVCTTMLNGYWTLEQINGKVCK